jgi:hypothetical protein
MRKEVNLQTTDSGERLRADLPADSGKSDFRSLHIRIKGGADRFDDVSASPFVQLLKDAPNGTEPRQVRVPPALDNIPLSLLSNNRWSQARRNEARVATASCLLRSG